MFKPEKPSHSFCNKSVVCELSMTVDSTQKSGSTWVRARDEAAEIYSWVQSAAAKRLRAYSNPTPKIVG